MSAAQKIIDKKALQVLVPFNALSPVHFNEVAQKTVIEEVRAGRLVFKEGDTDNQSVYLLSGEISLVTGNQVVGTVTAGSDASRHPIAHQQPRQVTARAKTSVVVARVDSSLLDIMLTWDQSSGYEVSEIDEDEDDDWMTRILQSQAFLKLPPSNIQRLLMQVESFPAKAGDVVIRQGGDGDYFYIIKSGRCMVTRKPSANAKEVKLAELKDGDAFGEDALVSDAKRNATVTMITDGSLMRLAKKDFVELLKEPLLNKLNYAEAAAKVAKGAVWLDVRLPGEYENLHIPDSRNIPLSALRLEANGLSAAKKYIVCCDTGRRSASAAFVLSQRGFDVYVLSEGLGGVPSEALRGASANTPPEPEVATKGVQAPVAAEPAASPPRPAAAAGNAAAAATQGQMESLEAEKRELAQQLAQLTERVGDLLEELERVRSEAREQILELEQTLADARQESAAAEAAVNEMRASMETRARANETAQELSDALEAELAERREREVQLNSELKALRARLTDLESAHRDHESLKTDAEAKQADHLRRIAELEAAATAHVTAHNEAMQRAEAATGQVAALQGELAAALESRAALEARLAAEEGAQAQAVAAGQQSIAELQTRVGALEAELQQRAAEVTAQEARIESLAAERDRLQAEQAASGTDRNGLQEALVDAQARIEALEAAGGERVSELEIALAAANEQLQAELVRSAALQSGQADFEGERNELRAALEQAQARIRALEATSGEQVQCLEATLEEARREAKALESEYAKLNSDRNDLEGRIAAADARAAELDAALRTQAEAANALQLRFEQAQEEVRRANGAVSAGQDEVAALRAGAEQQAAESQETITGLQQRLSSLEQALKEASAERDRLAAEQTAAASGRGVQDEALAQLRAELTETQNRLRDADNGRAEAAARLAEMSAATESSRREHEQVLNEIEQRVREESQLRLRELTSELEGARSALARVQDERDNLKEASKTERLAEQAELETALVEARTALETREQALSQAQAVEQTLRAQLDELRSASEAQQQALNAELEQLRVVTTADIEATQRRLLQLQDELSAARKLNKGGSAPEELERLRMLLDEAREEANSARAEADHLREQANAAQDAVEVSDEMAAMRVQLADIQCRVDEAMNLRDRAEQEVAQLRQELQAQQRRQSVPQPAEVIDDQPRRSGAWLGVVAGLILGVGGAGAALWFLPATQGTGAGGQAPTVATPAAPPPMLPTPPPVATPSKAATPTKAAAPQAKPAEPPAAVAAPVARAPVTAVRELQDPLGNGWFAPRLVEIPAVTFSMGSGISSLDPDERPRHEVELRRFAIGKYEVTFDEYDHFARMTGRALPDDKGRGRGKRPVVNITWEEAVAYTRWLSDQTGARYRLPSEAEWEYAAGGGARTLYWWGNAPGEGQANCFNCGSEWDNALPAPVGSFAPNPLGLHDTAGNVAEWIQDCYNADYVGAPADGSAWVTVGCTRRVVRGGGFNSPANALRLTKRGQQSSSVRLDDVGFRVVREP